MGAYDEIVFFLVSTQRGFTTNDYPCAVQAGSCPFLFSLPAYYSVYTFYLSRSFPTLLILHRCADIMPSQNPFADPSNPFADPSRTNVRGGDDPEKFGASAGASGGGNSVTFVSL